jgi:hypothetical protein
MNNIKLNFFKYVHQYINQYFLFDNPNMLPIEQYKKLTDIEKKAHNKLKKNISKQNNELKKELIYVKMDIITGSNNCDEKYHEWINEHKEIILPELIDKFRSHEDQLKINPEMYLIHMLKMNKILETNNKKMFQAISLRTSMTDKYVHFDSSTLKDIFNKVGKNITNEELWKKYFNIDNKKLKLKDYSFNYQISTDGISVSINFIKNDKIEEKQQKSLNMANASKQSKIDRKGKTKEEIIELNIKKKENDKFKKNAEMEKQKKQLKEKREQFKLLSKEEKEKIKLRMKIIKNNVEYIEDAIKNSQMYEILKKAFENGKIAYGDPGMRALLAILGKGKQQIIKKSKLKNKRRIKRNKCNKKEKRKSII